MRSWMQALKSAARSQTVWRVAVGLLAVAAVVQGAIELAAAPRVLQPGRSAAPLFEGHPVDRRGPVTFVVVALPAGSPLAAAGVQPGDEVRYARPMAHWQPFVPGETVTLTVSHDGAERVLQVQPVASTSAPQSLPVYLARHVAWALTLLLCTYFGLRRVELWSARVLPLGGLLASVRYPVSAPLDWHLPWLDLLASVSFTVWTVPMALFAFGFPDDRPVGWRARLLRLTRWLLPPYLLSVALYFVLLHADWYEPGLRAPNRVFGVVIGLLFVTGIVLGWQGARGEARLRFRWILATLGTIVFAWFADAVIDLAGLPVRGPSWTALINGVVLVGVIGFAYAVTQRRIFDFDLAVNRALVFSVVGAILFGAIQIAHHAAAEFLRMDDPRKAALLSALLALAVYLSFGQLKRVVERGVDRLFFREWSERETALRRFVDEARLAGDAPALAALCCGALKRFADAPAVRLWQVQPDGSYRCVAATDATAPDPAPVVADDAEVLALRAHGRALRPEAGPLAALGLVVPLRLNGRLLAWAGLVPRADGLPWRPDQVAVMESVASDLAACFLALEADALRRALDDERRRGDLLAARLDTALGLRGAADA